MTTPSKPDRPRTLAVISGERAFAACSEACQRQMIASNPPGTCEAGTADRTGDRDICAWCYQPTPIIPNPPTE